MCPGFLEGESKEWMIRILARTADREAIGNTVLQRDEKRSVLLKDVAEIEFDRQVMRGDAGVNGKRAVILGVQKQPSADTVRLSGQVEAMLDSIRETLPEGVRYFLRRF